MIDGLDGAVGQVGPVLTEIATVGAERVPGQTAEDYIDSSIVDPAAFLVEECPTGPCANVMPADFGERLETQERDDLVMYLLTLE